VAIDGDLVKEIWQKADWTDEFIDIQST